MRLRPTSFRSWPTGRIILCGLAVVLLGAVAPWPARAMAPATGLAAQNPVLSIQQASLRLWPEYDDPGLLVIFAGAFTNTVSFPQKVAFPLPAGARGIQATAQDDAGGLLSQPWDSSGGKLTYTLPTPSFQVEYYVDRPPAGNQRELSYAFEVPYPIESLVVSVQQPARSTGFSLSPAPESSSQESDGFTYSRFSRQHLQAGDRIAFTIRYSKPDQAPSVTAAPASSAQSDDQVTAASSARSTPPWLPYVLIGLGVVGLAGAGVYWFTFQRRVNVGPVRGRAGDRPAARVPSIPAVRPRAGVAARPASAVGAGAPPAVGQENTVHGIAYCTQCGHPLGPGDRFCSQCGTTARR